MLIVLPVAAPAIASLYQQSVRHQAWLWLYGSNFLVAWKDAWVLPGFHHFWSLAVEEHFYLLWPFVIFLCNRRQAMIACAVSVIGAASLRVLLLWWGNSAVAVETLTPCRMDSLAIGGFLALAARGPAGVRALVPWVCAVAAMGGLAAAALYWFVGSTWSLEHTFVALFFGAVVVVGITIDPYGGAGRIWNSHAL